MHSTCVTLVNVKIFRYTDPKIGQIMKKVLALLLLYGISLFAADYYYAYGKRVELKKLYETRNSQEKGLHYYLMPNGERVGVADQLLVACETALECEEELKKYHFEKIKKLSNNLFVVTINTKQNIFEMAQILYKESGIKLAEPNFTKTLKKR